MEISDCLCPSSTLSLFIFFNSLTLLYVTNEMCVCVYFTRHWWQIINNIRGKFALSMSLAASLTTSPSIYHQKTSPYALTIVGWHTLARSKCTQPPMYCFQSKQWFSYEKSTMWAAIFLFLCKRHSTINLSHRFSLMMRSQSVSMKFGLGFSAYTCIFCTSIRQCCRLQVFIHCNIYDCEGVLLLSN